MRNLKPLPACDALVDKCIECGFCEPKCPSRGLTLSPRQRIVGWREIARRAALGDTAPSLRAAYDYAGIDTCAACGLCATACPVGIETGLLIKSLRGRRAGPVARGIAGAVAGHFALAAAGVRAGLGVADLAHRALGTRAMDSALAGLRAATGGAVPKWSPALPRPVRFKPPVRSRAAPDTDAIVYFPSCAARNMGAPRGQDGVDPLPVTAARLFAKAGFGVVYPERLSQLCCGQPFESKGLLAAADRKAAELESALRAASDGGRLPIVFDTSPCAYRMKRFLAGRLPVLDAVEFVHDTLLARVALVRGAGPVAVHPVCSLRKMGIADKLRAVALQCSRDVVSVDAVQCCGFAGDRGFVRPELNAHALRDLRAALPEACRAGYSTSRTCEIGLSEHAGIPYESILFLVEACARPGPGQAFIVAKSRR